MLCNDSVLFVAQIEGPSSGFVAIDVEGVYGCKTGEMGALGALPGDLTGRTTSSSSLRMAPRPPLEEGVCLLLSI